MPTFNPNQERPSFWTVLPGGTHEQIVQALLANALVQNVVQAKFANPDDMTARDHALDILTRKTGVCLGQVIAKRPLAPDDETLNLLRLLPSGTEPAIATAIGGSQETHDAFASEDVSRVVHHVSRQAGRCLFQAFTGQIGLGDINLGDLAGQLLKLAAL